VGKRVQADAHPATLLKLKRKPAGEVSILAKHGTVRVGHADEHARSQAGE